jgi:hypothetical protein
LLVLPAGGAIADAHGGAKLTKRIDRRVLVGDLSVLTLITAIEVSS